MHIMYIFSAVIWWIKILQWFNAWCRISLMPNDPYKTLECSRISRSTYGFLPFTFAAWRWRTLVTDRASSATVWCRPLDVKTWTIKVILGCRNSTSTTSSHVWRATRIGNQSSTPASQRERESGVIHANDFPFGAWRRLRRSSVGARRRFLPFRMRHGRLVTSRNSQRRRRALESEAAWTLAVEGRAEIDQS